MRPCMWSACASTMRKNWSISARGSAGAAPSTAAAEPLMEVSGARNSWLTMPRNSARRRSSSSSGARSCMVTTTETTSPRAPRIGVTLMSVSFHAASVGHREQDLLGTHRRRVAKGADQRHLAERKLAPVGEAAVDDLQQLLGRTTGGAQSLHDASGLAVERHQKPALRVEHHDADRRGLDQGFEIGPGALLVVVDAGVGDRGGRLRGEEHQQILVLVGERRSALLLGEEEAAHMHAPVAHRSALEGLRPYQVGGEAERAHVGRKFREPYRSGQVAQVGEEPGAVGPLGEAALLLGGESRGDELAHSARPVDGGDDAVARRGQGARSVDDFLEHGGEIEACADAQNGGTQR